MNKTIYRKEYREKNKEKLAIKAKEYREKNKEKLAIKAKEYYERNKEKLSIKAKEYRERNKEKIVFLRKEYYERNKEKLAIKADKWRKENPEKFKESQKNSKVKIKNFIDPQKTYQNFYTKLKYENSDRIESWNIDINEFDSMLNKREAYYKLKVMLFPFKKWVNTKVYDEFGQIIKE